MTEFIDHFRLELADVAAGDVVPVPLFPLGEWKSAKYPQLSLTKQLADELIANFEAGILGTEPVLDSSGKHDTSAPAAGWFKRLHIEALRDGGEMLFGDCELTELGAKQLNEGLYKYDSVEIDSVVLNDSGETVPNVFKSATLTNTPVLRMLPPVLDAGEAISVALSEVTAAAPDPVQTILDDMDALAAKLDEVLRGKRGMPIVRTLLREVRAKAAAHGLAEDDEQEGITLGQQGEVQPETEDVSSDSSPAGAQTPSSPAVAEGEAREGEGTRLAEGDAAAKGVDPGMKTVIQRLKLTEDADETAVLTAVELLLGERDTERARADAAEKELAENVKASALAAFTAKLDEKIQNEGTIAPGEREFYLSEAERDVAHAEVAVARRTHKIIDLAERGAASNGAERPAKRADVELSEKTRSRMARDGIDYPRAMGLVLSEDCDLAERYEAFTKGKEG